MFGIGGFEFFVIILFGLLIFGPDKMPQLGRTIGRTMRQFNKVQDDMKRVITAEMYSKDPDKESSPFKPADSPLKKYESDESAVKVVGSTPPPQAAPSAPVSQADMLYGLDPQKSEAEAAEGAASDTGSSGDVAPGEASPTAPNEEDVQ